MEIDDRGARRLSAAENIQREDLSVFETIEAIVELVDSELAADAQYAAMGPDSVDRVKILLSKLDAVRRSEQGGYRVAKTAKMTSGKFAGSVEKIFKIMPKPLKWQSFYRHDLDLPVATPQDIRDMATRQKLSKSQIRALGKLSAVSESRLESFVEETSPALQYTKPTCRIALINADWRDFQVGRSVQIAADSSPSEGTADTSYPGAPFSA